MTTRLLDPSRMTRRSPGAPPFLIALIAAAVALGACTSESSRMPPVDETPRTIVIKAAGALVGPELELVSPAEVSIENGQIVSVGAPDPADDTTDTRVTIIEADDILLVPGFIDAHVHIEFFEPRSLLDGGITTARDLGWPPERIFALAEASRQEDFAGPEVIAAGPMLTAPGGYPTRAGWAPPGTGLEVATPQDAATAVAALAPKATVIKVALNPPVGPTLEPTTLRAIIQEAHSKGLKTTGHVYGLRELEKALDAGLDELAHMLMSTKKIPDRLIDRIVKQGMRVVPTLSIRTGRDQRIAIDNLRRFIAAGGRVIYGTDLGNGGPEPGIDRREVSAMSEAGMSTLDIIRSATVDSAGWLELGDRGYLEVGKRADIVGLPVRATDDIAALTRVKLVVREGVVAKAL